MRVSNRVAWGLTALGAVAGGILAWLVRTSTAGSKAEPVTAPLVTRAPESFEVAEVVFDSGFGKGWEDWGWGPREKTDAGALRAGFAGYGAVMFRHSELTAPFGGLVFKFRAPPKMGDFLAVALKYKLADESLLPSVAIDSGHVAELENGWREVLVPWSELNPKQSPFDRIVIQARKLTSSDWVEIDDVVLIKPRPLHKGGPARARSVKLAVHCDKPSVRINPLIYGISFGPRTSGETARRIGGNTMTRHNWELGTWNLGSDWFFENVKGTETIYDWLHEAPRDELMHAVVVPTIGWVAKDGTSVGFPVSKFGAQAGHDSNRPEAGNGKRPDGTPHTPGPATQTSIPAPPELIKRWIETLRRKDVEAGGRSVDMYILDNEPDLWHVTHRDVHPEPVTYDELLQRTIDYGTAIRSADPDAVIAGPTSWGWPAYFTSAKDAAANMGGVQPDRLRHGGVPIVPWYLQSLAEHERRTGVRILDVLDVHYYPQAPGVHETAGGRTDAEGAALRIRSTRSLWDPTYVDESWIGERVRLIPRLREWVEKNYPGRAISLGEWSFGAEEHISGALAIVEALGRFGQERLSAAFYWGPVKPGTAAYWAFRAYRNFDGRGGRFLDFSVKTSTAPGTSLFASRDEAGTRLVAVLANLDADLAADAEIDLASCGRSLTKRVFSYGPGANELREGKVEGRINRELVPPHSFSVIELALEPTQRR